MQKILSFILIITISCIAIYTKITTSNEIKILKSKIAKQNEKQILNIPYKKYLGNFNLTFYCPCSKCVGNKKIVRTASGSIPKANKTIAVDKKIIPLNSIVYIEGMGLFVAEDTGSAVKGNRIDVFVNSHDYALKLGQKTAKVYLLQ